MDIYTVQPVYERNHVRVSYYCKMLIYVNRPYKNKRLFHIMDTILADMIYLYMYILIKVNFYS